MNCSIFTSFFHSVVLCAIVAATCGCDRSARSLHLDEVQARESLTASLEAWKSGKQPDDLKPEIYIGEWDWKKGHSLVDYEVLPGEVNDGTNLHLRVRLTLKDMKGKTSKPEAEYIVGTSPVVTISRQD